MRNSIPRLTACLIVPILLTACGGNTDAGGSGTAQRQLAARAMAGATIASSFGVTDANGVLTVDSGAGLVFKVVKNGGDITSIKFNNGPELQLSGKGSQIASGIGATTTYTVGGGIAKITLSTSTLTHYLIVRQGENNIYMGTYTTAEPGVGELRWITRLDPAQFTNIPVASDPRNAVSGLDSGDVYLLADGTTRSKYYGNDRAMDMGVKGITGPGVGVFMAYGNRETSSGGPFYRDIQFQTTEVYNYMNSGHAQTEAMRMGLHGPYALMFNDGTSTPTAPDMSWMESQNLLGWVPAGQRGKVTGRGLYGFDLTHRYTIGFKNETAQYWAVAKAPNGNFTTPPMIPGTYTMTVYKEELELSRSTVTVSAGATVTLPAAAMGPDPDKDTALWRIGTWDGTPLELMNGKNISFMHPYDKRNANWGPLTYTVGQPASLFPAAEWRDQNGPITVKFDLTPEQIANHTIRIGMTVAYNRARPGISVNSWNAKTPAITDQPSTRSITVGNYRGNNVMFTFAVPSSAFVVGTNTLTIYASSGTAGAGFLSPGMAFDALDLL